MNDLTHLSLFTGIGGLDIAAEMAGFETVGQCEWADFPTKVLEKHWPGLPRWRDIRTLTGESFYERTSLRTVDIISGGFPCQPFSLAGQRRGTEDDRYLWPQMLRVVSELKPTWVIGENVAGLVSMVQPSAVARVESRIINRQQDEDFYEAVLSRQEDYLLPQLIGDLERIGYEVQAFVIPACSVGAAHRRDRIALVAHYTLENTSSSRLEQSRVLPKQQRRTKPVRASKSSANRARPKMRKDVADSESLRLQGERPTGEQVTRTRRQKEKLERVCLDGYTTGTGFSDGTNKPLGEPKSQPQPQRPNRRTVKPGLGGVADGIPPWMDGYWLTEPDIPRVASGVEDRADKLKALGNAVYWRQFYPIFAGIHHIEEGQP